MAVSISKLKERKPGIVTTIMTPKSKPCTNNIRLILCSKFETIENNRHGLGIFNRIEKLKRIHEEIFIGADVGMLDRILSYIEL